jgi:hypothetical protein
VQTKEELAKRVWLAKQEVPSWGPAAGGHSRRSIQAVSTKTAAHLIDDHTNPGERLAAAEFGRVPMAKFNPAVDMFGDDHTNPGDRLAVSDFGRVPIATFSPGVERFGDDHTNPGDRMKVSDFGRVPMATAGPVAGKVAPVAGTVRQNAGEERAKRAWLAKLDAPSWGKK